MLTGKKAQSYMNISTSLEVGRLDMFLILFSVTKINDQAFIIAAPTPTPAEQQKYECTRMNALFSIFT